MSIRDRVVIAVLSIAAAIVAPWLLVIQPKRDQAAKLQSQINSEQAQLMTVRSQLAAGAAARAAFASSYTTLVRLGEAVPTDDNVPSLIYQLQGAAQATGVNFQGLTLSSSGGAAPSTPGGKAPTLPPGATIGPAGFPIEPFSFTFTGKFFDLGDFLGRLQRFVVANDQGMLVSGRLMTLNAISLAPSSGAPGQLSATINATTYLLPASQGLLAGATPAGPASSTNQTVSNSTPSNTPPPAVVTASPLR